jgi:hypothetical protein
MEPLLSCEVVSLRRIAVFLFVEFKLKIPREFAKATKAISPGHQKLIELYAARRKK